MEPKTLPCITVSFSVDLELEFDPFKGKTEKDFAIAVEDDLIDALLELRPEVKNVFSSIVAVDTNG
jgi:hypothetical protein